MSTRLLKASLFLDFYCAKAGLEKVLGHDILEFSRNGKDRRIEGEKKDEDYIERRFRQGV